ncbi:hypothetical protein CY658_12135 [Variovorax sp. RO1]|uniref:hypothetical protein n=1 Tax=Variovorax sp. RO1 TaxID=2066034 RepID=UPI000C7187B5|nr:hypothetical protein [Variovorax sp. RO1]PLC04585.1 hypothetical protein CY658_12135 [Variovorax sp. RO1]
MSTPTYIGIEGARLALADIGIHLTYRQIKRAADPDPSGQRKLPFFVDPIDKRLKIDKNTLLDIYIRMQVNAENNAKISVATLRKGLEPRL